MMGALGLCLTAGACKEDPPTPKLFDETGVWSVIDYDLEGSGILNPILNSNRRDAFMLSFDPVEKVVTTASCVESATNSNTPDNSPCLVSPSTTEWQCRCFSYDFVREEMLWREFNAGDIPPIVSLSDSETPMGEEGGGESGSGSGGGDGGEPSDDLLVYVAEIMDISSTFNFRPLPEDLFGSNGESSRFVLQSRAGSVFDKVYDDPEGRAACSPCVP